MAVHRFQRQGNAIQHLKGAYAPRRRVRSRQRLRCRVVRLGDLKEKKRPHHVEKQLTNNSC